MRVTFRVITTSKKQAEVRLPQGLSKQGEVLNSRERDGHRELLAAVATDLLQFSDPAQLIRSVFDRVSSQTTIETCLAYLFEQGRLEAVFLGGFDTNQHPHLRTVELGDGLCGHVAKFRHFERRDGISQSGDPLTKNLRNLGLESACCYPLLSGESILGTLLFGTRKNVAFTDTDVELQRAIADQVALAVDRINLLRELAQSNQKLLALNAELRRAHSELEQIAFSASHELREPVRHLSIYTEMLEMRLKVLTEDVEARRFLQFVLSNAKRVELLFSDLLEYTGVGRESPASRVLDTRFVVERVCARLQSLIQQTGTKIFVQDLPPIDMLDDDLTALFENLIENAILHHGTDGEPEIHIFARQLATGSVICVQDDGVGIDPARSDQIFGLSKRSYSEANLDAFGIGLTLCRKILERNKGRIWLEPAPRKGALLCFTLAQTNRVRTAGAS